MENSYPDDFDEVLEARIAELEAIPEAPPMVHRRLRVPAAELARWRDRAGEAVERMQTGGAVLGWEQLRGLAEELEAAGELPADESVELLVTEDPATGGRVIAVPDDDTSASSGFVLALDAGQLQGVQQVGRGPGGSARIVSVAKEPQGGWLITEPLQAGGRVRVDELGQPSAADAESLASSGATPRDVYERLTGARFESPAPLPEPTGPGFDRETLEREVGEYDREMREFAAFLSRAASKIASTMAERRRRAERAREQGRAPERVEPRTAVPDPAPTPTPEPPSGDAPVAGSDPPVPPVRPKPEGSKFCTSCGAPRKGSTRFCTSCGRPFGS